MTKIEIKVLTQPTCTKCPQAKQMVERLAQDSPDVRWTEIDVSQDKETARRYAVMATPTIIANDQVIARGVPRDADLRQRVRELGVSI